MQHLYFLFRDIYLLGRGEVYTLSEENLSGEKKNLYKPEKAPLWEGPNSDLRSVTCKDGEKSKTSKPNLTECR